MAQIDASGLQFSYDARPASSVQVFAVESSSSDHYTWVTGDTAPFYRITALSFDGGINASTLSGSIDTINVTNDAGAPGFSIEDLNVPLSALVDSADPVASHRDFWSAVLVGATTIVTPESGVEFSIMGDFVTVQTGEDLSGGADLFVGSSQSPGSSSSTLVGDALSVAAGATLDGGSDTWTDVSALYIIGDAGIVPDISEPFTFDVLGEVFGGADVFNLSDAGATPAKSYQFLIGDVVAAGEGSIVEGGGDAFTLRNIAGFGVLVGDIGVTLSSGVGGSDQILIETTVAGRAFVSFGQILGDIVNVGDVGRVGARGFGGDDTITLNNVRGAGDEPFGGAVSGDFSLVTSGFAVGGDDVITIGSTFAQTSTDQRFSIVDSVAGDALATSSETGFTPGDEVTFQGGADRITLLRAGSATATTVSGDVIDALDPVGRFVGGNDAITVLFNRAQTAVGPYLIAGDASQGKGLSFTGGNDTIALNIQSAAPSGSTAAQLVGDVGNFEVVGSTELTLGDDLLIVTSNAFQSTTLYGDAIRVAGNNISVVDGDDTVTGGAGADTIFGDTATVVIVVSGGSGSSNRQAGTNVLDGRGGNDVLIGGFGPGDTAVFSLNRSVQVNLNGIPSSAAAGGDLFEAIGQGNDQLVDIENVIGSALDDVIVGDGASNVIEGAGGADRINGGGDRDTASYDLSTAGVVVNLSTGLTSGGHAQGDRLVSIEDLIGSDFADTLVGSSADNTLDGRLGADSLRGLGGADIYLVDNAGDVVDEAFSGSGGTDRVVASVSVNLSNAARFKGDIENVSLLAGADLNAVGNGLANTITGNDTGNALAGGLGNDTLFGRGGSDSFLFNTALGATNVDRILDFDIDDRIDLENAVFTTLTTTGVLANALFKNTASGAIDGDDRVIYDSGTGALIYDTNGSGAGGATQFATIGTGIAVTNADFFVV